MSQTRREFIRNALLSAAGIALFPSLSLSKITNTDYKKWFKENSEWLLTWFDNAEPFPTYEGMQIFKTISNISSTVIKTTKNKHNDFLKTKEGRAYHARRMLEHKIDILYASVFGITTNAFPEGSPPYTPVRTMSGFMEQKGRLPNKHDKVKFKYLGGNGVTRWLSVHELRDRYMSLPGQNLIILTECKLEVL